MERWVGAQLQGFNAGGACVGLPPAVFPVPAQGWTLLGAQPGGA